MAKSEKQIVQSTKEGKLFIQPADLFEQKKVQALINKALESKALVNVNKVTIKLG